MAPLGGNDPDVISLDSRAVEHVCHAISHRLPAPGNQSTQSADTRDHCSSSFFLDTLNAVPSS